MEEREAMVVKGAMAAAVVVMVVATVVMEAEIGVTAVVKGAMAVVAATPTGVGATRVVAVEDTETTGWFFCLISYHAL